MPSNYLHEKKVLILTEAGKNIGFGHFTRCQSLEQNLRKNGYDVKTILYLNGENILDTDALILNWLEDRNKLLTYNYYENIIIDSYLADAPFYSFIKSHFKYVIVIDDYNRIVYNADLIINPNIFFEEINYGNQVAATYGGKNYVILRNEFRQHKHINLPKPTLENVLITIGGSDFRNLLPIIINSVLKRFIKITVVAPDGGIKLQDERLKILGVQNSQSMFNLYDQADMVISACGQTLHELASMGKSTIAICLDIDQEPNQRFYLKQGFLQHEIQWDDKKLSAAIKSAINDLEPFYKRNEILQYSKNILNIDGVDQIVKSITKLITNHKNEFT